MKKQKNFISHMSSVFSGMACRTISKTPVNLPFPILILFITKKKPGEEDVRDSKTWRKSKPPSSKVLWETMQVLLSDPKVCT
jgi:hypothetical protein